MVYFGIDQGYRPALCHYNVIYSAPTTASPVYLGLLLMGHRLLPGQFSSDGIDRVDKF